MELVWLRPLFFDPAGERSRQRLPAAAGATPVPNRRLVCVACRHGITDQDERIAVQGDHEHTFTNPHGVTYHIACFRNAQGCVAVGETTADFSWFSGYAWRVALCANCQRHLGWRFQSQQDYFYGLIVNRLALEDGNDSEST